MGSGEHKAGERALSRMLGRSPEWSDRRILVANDNHVAVLRQGVTTWNQWRGENIHLKPDLSGANLQDIYLCYADLRDTDFSHADLGDADLRFANLSRGNLSGSNLRYTNLSCSNLSGESLSGANLSGVNLSGANLSDSTLNDTDLSGADLSGAFLSDADFRGAFLRFVNLSNADLSDANLNAANLSGANLRGADLRRADVGRANLRDADLGDTNLSEGNVSEANLRGANLIGANLSHANLRESDLSKADLSRVNVKKATLSGALLREATLSGADLSEANLSHADMSRADLRDANLSAVRAPSTNFNEATLTGACLQDWTLDNATTLEDVVCDYFYLMYEHGAYAERRPSRGNFDKGGFTALFQKPSETVALSFKEGINWKAFLLSFQKLRRQYDEHLTIQAIEQKRNGSLLVRLELSPDLDKDAVETRAKKLYEAQLKIVEAQYEKQLRSYGENHTSVIQQMIESTRQESSTLIGVLTMLSKYQKSPGQPSPEQSFPIQSPSSHGSVSPFKDVAFPENGAAAV
ncbi:MAG: pentapeptide repeat-containing protein [Cyanobacteria bacterium P01_E01_bin.6]